METIVKLYSNNVNEINIFLNQYFNNNEIKKQNIDYYDSKTLEYELKYKNPIEMSDIIGVFIENNDKYKINMWISMDKNVLINITDHNADKIIRYLFERYPY